MIQQPSRSRSLHLRPFSGRSLSRPTFPHSTLQFFPNRLWSNLRHWAHVLQRKKCGSASVGVSVSAGVSVGVSVGVSAAVGVGVSAGVSVGAGVSLGVGARAGVDSSASAGVGAIPGVGASVIVGVSVSTGVSTGVSECERKRVGVSAGVWV